MIIPNDIKESVILIAEEKSFGKPTDKQIDEIIELYKRYTNIEVFLNAIKDSKNVIIKTLFEQGFEKDYIIEYMKKFEVYVHIYFQKIPEKVLEESVENYKGGSEISDVISVLIQAMPSPCSFEYDDKIIKIYDFLNSIRDTDDIIMFVKDPIVYMDNLKKGDIKKIFIELMN